MVRSHGRHRRAHPASLVPLDLITPSFVPVGGVFSGHSCTDEGIDRIAATRGVACMTMGVICNGKMQ
jgi:hypothetical protein